jgi:hypothetical protein
MEIIYFVATILSIYFCTWAAFVQGSLIAAVLHVRIFSRDYSPIGLSHSAVLFLVKVDSER